MNAAILISHHNVAFFMDTMRRARAAINEGAFERFRSGFVTKLSENASLDV
jgi:tRNA-guanine family transglycosylase